MIIDRYYIHFIAVQCWWPCCARHIPGRPTGHHRKIARALSKYSSVRLSPKGGTKNPTGIVSDYPTPRWRKVMEAWISVKSVTRNVSGKLRVCSGRWVGAIFVVVRLDEVHLVYYFSQSLPVLLRNPILWPLSKKYSPITCSDRKPCHR